MGLVDSCLRKVNNIDKDGVQELCVTHASKANIIQSFGRLGRQNQPGVAHLMISETEYEYLPSYPQTEVNRNPLYHQLMELYSNNLPVGEIIGHHGLHRIIRDTKFLEHHKALEVVPDVSETFSSMKLSDSDSDEDNEFLAYYKKLSEGVEDKLKVYKVTKLGEIMACLPCSIRVARYIATALTTITNPTFLWCAIVVGAYIETKIDIFRYVSRKPRESEQDYLARKSAAEEDIEPWLRGDCIDTFLNVWLSIYANAFATKKEYIDWCFNNQISDYAIKNLNSSLKHIMDGISRSPIGKKVQIIEPQAEECETMLCNLETLHRAIQIPLLDAFAEWKMNLHQRKLSSTKLAVYRRGGQLYFVDRGVKGTKIHAFDAPSTIIATNIRKRGPAMFISGIFEVLGENNKESIDWDQFA
jgi:HrpA-like RNA helicase